MPDYVAGLERTQRAAQRDGCFSSQMKWSNEQTPPCDSLDAVHTVCASRGERAADDETAKDRLSLPLWLPGGRLRAVP